MVGRKKRADYAPAIKDGCKVLARLHSLSKQVIGPVNLSVGQPPSFEPPTSAGDLQSLSDERDAAVSRLRSTCDIASSSAHALESPAFLPATPGLFWRVRLRLVELTNEQPKTHSTALAWRPCDRRSVEVRVWLLRVGFGPGHGHSSACCSCAVGPLAWLHETGQIKARKCVTQPLGISVALVRRSDTCRHRAQSQVHMLSDVDGRVSVLADDVCCIRI